MTEARSNPEHVDVLIVGSGPAGSTYARVVGDARPDVSILMVEAGPRLRGVPRRTHLEHEPRRQAHLPKPGPRPRRGR